MSEQKLKLYEISEIPDVKEAIRELRSHLNSLERRIWPRLELLENKVPGECQRPASFCPLCGDKRPCLGNTISTRWRCDKCGTTWTMNTNEPTDTTIVTDALLKGNEESQGD